MLDYDHTIFKAILDAQDAGESIVLATVVKVEGSAPCRSVAKMVIFENGQLVGNLGGGEIETQVIKEAKASLENRSPRLFNLKYVDPDLGSPNRSTREAEIILEPFIPPATILVIGCGYVGRAVACAAPWFGFQVVVTDERSELESAEIIPEANIILPGDITEAL